MRISLLLHLLVDSETDLFDHLLDVAASLLLQLVHDDQGDLLDQGAVRQNRRLVIQSVDALVQAGLVSAGQRFAGFLFSLYLVLKISHVDQKLVDAVRVLAQHLFLELSAVFALSSIHLQLEPAV